MFHVIRKSVSPIAILRIITEEYFVLDNKSKIFTVVTLYPVQHWNGLSLVIITF